jgi:LEA14-like dessication related protein
MVWILIKYLKSKTIVALIFISIQLLAGCAGVGKHLEPPRISLAQIQVQEFTGLEAVFQIKLRVFNTNDIDLNVKGIEADLEINGKPFATGVSQATVKIPSFGTELVPIIVYSSVVDIVKGIHGLQEAEQLKYRLKGKLRVSGKNLMSTTLPFESAGQVKLNESPAGES